MPGIGCLKMYNHLAGGKGWMGIRGRRNCMYKMWWYESMESSQSFVSSLVSRDMVGGEIGQRDCWLENVRFPHEIQVEFSHSLETETETRLLRYPLLSLLLFFTWLFYSYLCNKLFLPHNSCRKYSHPSISLLSLPVMGLAAVKTN